MARVTIAEAKDHLESLVDDLATGKETEIVLTREGKPIARLTTPVRTATAAFDPQKVQAAIDGFAEIRKRTSLGGMNIKELIEEGRM